MAVSPVALFAGPCEVSADLYDTKNSVVHELCSALLFADTKGKRKQTQNSSTKYFRSYIKVSGVQFITNIRVVDLKTFLVNSSIVPQNTLIERDYRSSVNRTTFVTGGISRGKSKYDVTIAVGSFCKCLLLSYFQIVYKKGHDERKSKYTSLPDPPDVEQARKVTRQLSDVSRMQFSSFNRNFHFGIRQKKVPESKRKVQTSRSL